VKDRIQYRRKEEEQCYRKHPEIASSASTSKDDKHAEYVISTYVPYQCAIINIERPALPQFEPIQRYLLGLLLASTDQVSNARTADFGAASWTILSSHERSFGHARATRSFAIFHFSATAPSQASKLENAMIIFEQK